jgi:demethylmenaquinone methyltransferase / 2-methoxy-6-polyprenyl-1,4-benzoquinol methylase
MYPRMKADSPAQKSAYVQDVFQRIAPRYDLMNRLMTAGQDLAWRRKVIARAQIPPGGQVLDLGAGTGDLAREALAQQPTCRPVAADFTFEMMKVGRQSPRRAQTILSWSCADALHLPFPDQSFDALISGFLLRNVTDLDQALREQYRVLRPNGRVVALDTTRPRVSMLSPFIRFHMHRVIPFLGGLLTGSRDAYTYLPSSSENFLLAEDLQNHFTAAGFYQTGFQREMFGTIAIHWGVKPAAQPDSGL